MSNYHQRTGRKVMLEQSLDDEAGVRAALESLASSAPDLEESRMITQLVQLTLDHLPDRYGKALEWKYVDGLSVSEIAGRWDTTEISVQSLLARARRAFRAGLVELQKEVAQ